LWLIGFKTVTPFALGDGLFVDSDMIENASQWIA
jgi:hypothetical protein